MASIDESMKKLRELDEELTKLSREQASSDRVTFNYHVSPNPVRVTRGNLKWYEVTLSISPQPGFDLNRIEQVVYVLHPTFRPPTVSVKNPHNGFQLRIRSWGDFHSMAIVKYKDTPRIDKLIQYLPIGVPSPF